MRKKTSLVDNVLCVLVYIEGNKISDIDMSKVSLTLKYHYFEVVNSEILDCEGQKYEEVDYFSWLCALSPPVHDW